MAIELAVLVIHGMGSQENDHFADDMIDEMKERLSDLDKDPDTVVFQPIYWADIVEPRQKAYLDNAQNNNDLDYIDLRRFMISALGDASAYQKLEDTNTNTTYEKIHTCIDETLKSLYEDTLSSTSVPVIIMAHSLGGHIMSNYIWDMQKADPADVSDFQKLETLCGLLTFGCNIPLFTFSYDNITPITFPPTNLPADLKAKAKWLNYYDPDDILAYPLRSINEPYSQTVSEDIAINVGGLFSMWNPLSHLKYWTDNDFTKPAAKYLAKFL